MQRRTVKSRGSPVGLPWLLLGRSMRKNPFSVKKQEPSAEEFLPHEELPATDASCRLSKCSKALLSVRSLTHETTFGADPQIHTKPIACVVTPGWEIGGKEKAVSVLGGAPPGSG